MFGYEILKFVNAQGVIYGDHVYFYPANPSSTNYFALNDLISGCTSASFTESGVNCPKLSLSMASAGPLTSNYPRPNM